MADFSPTEVTQLLQALQRPGGFDAAIQDALSALSAVKGAAPIPKEQKKTADLILKLIPQSLQSELRRDIAADNTGVALAKLQAQPQILQMRIAGGIELEQAKGARQIAVKQAGTEEAIRQREEFARVDLEAEQARKAAAVALPPVEPQVQAFINKQEAELRNIIKDTAKPLPPHAELEKRLEMMKIENTNGPGKATLLQNELDLRRQTARTATEVALQQQAPEAFNNPGAKQQILELAETQGQKVSSKVIQTAQQSALAETAQIQRLADIGVQTRTEGGRIQVLDEGKKKIFGESPGDAVKRLVEQAETARLAGDVAGAEKATAGIPKARSRAALKRGGGIAGALAALFLLPKLLGGGGNEQAQAAQQQALQLQMLQQAQQAQNQNALTQSLVQSRGSQAGLNDARAQLLQLQALQAAGAGGGGLV